MNEYLNLFVRQLKQQQHCNHLERQKQLFTSNPLTHLEQALLTRVHVDFSFLLSVWFEIGYFCGLIYHCSATLFSSGTSIRTKLPEATALSSSTGTSGIALLFTANYLIPLFFYPSYTARSQDWLCRLTLLYQFGSYLFFLYNIKNVWNICITYEAFIVSSYLLKCLFI